MFYSDMQAIVQDQTRCYFLAYHLVLMHPLPAYSTFVIQIGSPLQEALTVTLTPHDVKHLLCVPTSLRVCPIHARIIQLLQLFVFLSS